MHELNDFYFIKLVNTIQSANIFAITSGFSSKAGSICGHLYGQISFFYNFIPVNICYRYFGSRNQIKSINLYMIHLSFFIRQLARTISGGFIHHQWRLDIPYNLQRCYNPENIVSVPVEILLLYFYTKETRYRLFYCPSSKLIRSYFLASSQCGNAPACSFGLSPPSLTISFSPGVLPGGTEG